MATRKLTSEFVGECFNQGKPLRAGNVEVIVENDRNEKKVIMILFSNIIASKQKGKTEISCVLNIPTTRHYLNMIKGVSVNVKKGKTYLNGNIWENPNILTQI